MNQHAMAAVVAEALRNSFPTAAIHVEANEGDSRGPYVIIESPVGNWILHLEPGL